MAISASKLCLRSMIYSMLLLPAAWGSSELATATDETLLLHAQIHRLSVENQLLASDRVDLQRSLETIEQNLDNVVQTLLSQTAPATLPPSRTVQPPALGVVTALPPASESDSLLPEFLALLLLIAATATIYLLRHRLRR
ncbi:MAG: hypothetical protein HQL49_03245 [Gammaproteobacteria bacterium]|nr:hypothetical protein [Gammaproteobacteria bacterium]